MHCSYYSVSAGGRRVKAKKAGQVGDFCPGRIRVVWPWGAVMEVLQSAGQRSVR